MLNLLLGKERGDYITRQTHFQELFQRVHIDIKNQIHISESGPLLAVSFSLFMLVSS